MILQSLSQIWTDILGVEPKTAEVLLATVSVVVSGLMYTIYRKQVKLSQFEQRPILHTNRYRIPSGADSRQNPGVIIELKNHGNGGATNMSGKVTIAPVRIDGLDSGWGMLLFWLRERIPKSASAWTRLTAPGDEDEDSEWNEIHGSKIGPGETEEYRVPFSLNTNTTILPDRWSWNRSRLTVWRSRDPNTLGFTSALSELSVDDERLSDHALQPHYRLKVSVEHENPAGYRGSEPVFDYIIPPFESQTLEDALEEGRPYEEFKDNPAGYLNSVLVKYS